MFAYVPITEHSSRSAFAVKPCEQIQVDPVPHSEFGIVVTQSTLAEHPDPISVKKVMINNTGQDNNCVVFFIKNECCGYLKSPKGYSQTCKYTLLHKCR